MSREAFDIEAALEKCHAGTAWQRDLIHAQLIAAAPDMAEVERLLEAYDREYASGGSVEDYDRARTALLDYVRGVMAERDGLIHDNTRLMQIAAQEVSAAEVPMPDVHDYGYSDSDIGWVETLACDESDVSTYGDAREAAGYVRGLEVRLSPEKMRIAAAGWREFDFVEGLAGEAAMIDRICSAIYAALRGEVKP